MKNYKNAVPLALTIFMALGIYTNVDGAVNDKKELEQYLSEAKEYAELDIIDDALACYDAAREIDDSLAINLEEGELLVSSGRISEAVKWGEEMKAKFPKEPEAYSFLLAQYIAAEEYEDCFDLYDAICSIGVINDDIKEQMQSIMYEYSIGYEFYEDVGIFSRGYAAVCKNEKWGYVSETGSQKISRQFSRAGAFTDYAAVCDENGEWYYITTEGKKKYVVKNLKNCSYLSAYVDEVLAAKSDSGYGIYTIDFECIADSFEDVTAFNGGVAAAKDSKGWYLINAQGERISDSYYGGVVVDEKGICYRNDRLFVKDGMYYKMLDAEGNEIGIDAKVEDAQPFLEADGLAAVKVGGVWGFINKDGEFVIEPQYREAHSFSNGYAAVAERDAWGFITEDNTLVLDYEFGDAKDFNSSGCVFIYTDNAWRLLKLYKDNH